MELQVSAVDVKLFSVSSEYKTFVADASELRGHNLEQRLYDDSADAGFALWNARTNTVTRWAYYSERRDRENELVATLYTPTPSTLRKHPMLLGWQIHVLND
jgi:hypothetical protein